MTAGLELPFRPDGWTVDDLDDLPDDPPFRYELVDGALIVSPPPPNRHNVVANRLDRLLAQVLAPQWEPVTPGSLEFDVRNWRAPDVLVVSRACLQHKYAGPGDTLLAVEVMSPGSVSTDRLAKPEQYAKAGIPYFWRIEPNEPVMLTYALDGDVYRETGRFSDQVVIDAPVELSFRLSDLLA